MIEFAMWRTQISSKSLRVQINRCRQLDRTAPTDHAVFRRAQALICVCDVSDSDSFDYLKTIVQQVYKMPRKHSRVLNRASYYHIPNFN